MTEVGGNERRSIQIVESDAGQRLDLVLAERITDLSRSRIQALVRDGRVIRGDVVVNEPNLRVKPGERYVLDIPPPSDPEVAGEAIPLEILYEDDHLLILVKPAGLVVHPAAGHASGTLVNALIAHCGDSLSGIGGVRRPGIVHRIDKDVSGVMVVAKHDRAHVNIAGQFAVHSIGRAYEAIVWGLPQAGELVIEKPIGRHPRDRKHMSVNASGKPAKTLIRLLEPAVCCAKVLCRLHTGRTHQIRVHMTSIGHSLLGDRIYHPRRRPKGPALLHETVGSLDRIALHAKLLELDHPETGKRMQFENPAPSLFDELLRLGRG